MEYKHIYKYLEVYSFLSSLISRLKDAHANHSSKIVWTSDVRVLRLHYMQELDQKWKHQEINQ
jgi:hypothetical protein